jgi:CheY-like chemotaxis protein
MERKSRILIVDDEENFAKLLKLNLENNGNYDILTARSGEAAIEAVKQHKPDLVLLDIMMPGMGGLQCLKQIKAMAPELPVTMVTAVWDEETGKKALQAGAYDYITKPVDQQYLKKALLVKLFR